MARPPQRSSRGAPVSHTEDPSASILSRLRKVEGQVRGLQRMVEAGRPCEEVLTQLSAVVNALRRTGLLVLSCALTRAALAALRDGRDPEPDIAGFASVLARLG